VQDSRELAVSAKSALREPRIFLREFAKMRSCFHLMNTRVCQRPLKLFALLLLMLTMFCGCAQRYKITLRNNQEIVTSTRPKFDKTTQTFRFNDSSGRPLALPGFRIKEIEPY
jgi:Bacterial protein of unknown function (DUF903)